VLLFCLSFVSNIYFLGREGIGNPNAVCRAALAVAMVERGATWIDSFEDLTDDKALNDGHYYCDKAPGMSFLAIPVAAAFVAIVNPQHDDRLWANQERATGGEKISITFAVLLGVCTVLTASLLTAVSVPAMCQIGTQLGVGIRGAVVIALIYGQATQVWLWATTFLGHSAAAALLVLAFHALLRITGERRAREAWWVLWFGVALGWATLVEMTAAVPTAILVTFALAPLMRTRALWRRLGLIVLGGFPEFALLLGYNWAAFGSPFDLGYSHAALFDAMRSGFYGIDAPNLEVLWEITLGKEHGVLWLSPVLALVPVGVLVAAMSPRWRALGALWALIVAYYFLLNSGYIYWDGGYSTGPRHVTAGLPFACLLLFPLWEAGGVLARRATAVFGVVSGLFCLIAVAADAAMPDDRGLTIAGYLLSRFWTGHFNAGLAFVLEHLGWPGVTPVLPFVVVWGVGGVALWRTLSLSSRAD
jgi:hypothetical protein